MLGIFLIVGMSFWVGTIANSVVFLAGAEKHGTLMPVSYSQSCNKASCEPTDGYIEGTGESLTWPNVVPLGKPFSVPLPYTRWFDAIVIEDKGEAIVSLALFLFLELLEVAPGSFFLWCAWGQISRPKKKAASVVGQNPQNPQGPQNLTDDSGWF